MDDIPIPPKVARLFERILTRERIPHAYLFAGRDEMEKQAAAKVFFQRILCEQGGRHDRKDAQCSSCTALERGIHPDFIRIRPDGSPPYISLDTIRAIRRKLSLSAVMGRKAVLIEQADRLESEAEAALLKTLEEPPPQTFFVLTVTIPDRISKTLRSRLIPIRFLPLGEKDLRTLIASSGLSETERNNMNRMIEGSRARAVAFLRNPKERAQEAAAEHLLDTLLSGSLPEQFKMIQELESNKSQFEELSRRLLVRFREALMSQLRGNEGAISDAKVPYGRSPLCYARFLEELLEIERLVLTRALPLRFAMESFLLSLKHP